MLNSGCAVCPVCSVSSPLSQIPFSSCTSCGLGLHRSLLSSCLILFVYLSPVINTKSVFQLLKSVSIILSFQHPECWPQKCCCSLVSIFSFDRNSYRGLCVIWLLQLTKLLQFLTCMLNMETGITFSLSFFFNYFCEMKKQMIIWTQLCNSSQLGVSCGKIPRERKTGGNTSLPQPDVFSRKKINFHLWN